MNRKAHFSISYEKMAEFCKQNHIRKLSLFGSVLRNDFRPGSDVDILVEFEPGHIPGYIRLAGMELEFSEMFKGCRADINTPQCLSPYFRDKVLDEAEIQYVQR